MTSGDTLASPAAQYRPFSPRRKIPVFCHDDIRRTVTQSPAICPHLRVSSKDTRFPAALERCWGMKNADTANKTALAVARIRVEAAAKRLKRLLDKLAKEEALARSIK